MKPVPSSTNSDGGWSLPDDDSSAAEDDESNISDNISAKSTTSRGSSVSVGEFLNRQFAESELELNSKSLRLFLQRKLESVGLPRQTQLFTVKSHGGDATTTTSTTTHSRFIPSHLFENIAKTVTHDKIVDRWLESSHGECLRIQIPTHLDNPFFVTSVTSVLAASRPRLRVATVITGPEFGSRDVDCSEYVLMSLCFQLLAVPDPNWDYSVLAADFKTAFSGLNRGWRISILWSLLHCFLCSGENKSRVLALSFPLDPQALEASLPTIDRLLKMSKDTERDIRVMLFLSDGSGKAKTPQTPFALTVNMSDDRTTEGLRADLQSWVDGVTTARPSLQRHRDDIFATFSAHLSQPLLVFSALHSVKTRLWISKHHWTNGSAVSPLNSLYSFLERVPEVDKTLVADIVVILRCCRRPLTILELSEAIAAGQPLSTSTPLGNNAPLDLEHDLNRTLPGLVYIENGLVWYLTPYLGSDSAPGNAPSRGPPAWLDMGPRAEMRLALICLRYISVWEELGESVVAKKEDSAGKRSFLNYAVTFWHRHFLHASRKGIPGDEVLQLLNHKPSLTQTWLTLQATFDPPIEKKAYEITADQKAQLLPHMIVKTFNIGLGDAIRVVAMATRLLPVMNGDLSSALTSSLWHYRDHKTNKTVSAWMKELGCSFNTEFLVQAFPYVPETTLDLLLAGQDSAQKYAKQILATAVRQGDILAVESCLKYLKPDAQLLSSLPVSTCLAQGCVQILEAVPSEERLSLSDDQKTQLRGGLFSRAVKDGLPDLVDLLLKYPLSPSQAEYTTMLLVATEAGQTRTVQSLTNSRGIKPLLETTNPTTQVSESPLHCASLHNFISIAKVLITESSTSMRDKDGDTPLHIAARCGHLDMVRLLVESAVKHRDGDRSDEPESDAALEIENYSSSIPIEVAIRSGNQAIVRYLLHKTPKTKTFERDLIHIATRCGNVEMLRLLLAFPGIDADKYSSSSGLTAIHIACQMGSVETARELIKRGAKAWPGHHSYPFAMLGELENRSDAIQIAHLLLDKHSRPGSEALNYALRASAQTGCDHLVALLLDAGADKNTKNYGKRTPIHHAAYNGHEATARILLLRGVDTTPVDRWGDTALVDATNKRHLKLVQLLLERGDRYPLEGRGCPLVELTKEGNKAALELILNLQVEFHKSAVLAECFHLALRNDNVEIVSLLLSYNVDANLESSKKYYGNAIHECALYGNTKMAGVLLDHADGVEGNSVNSQAGQYHTPLIAAVAWRYANEFTKPQNKRERRIKHRLAKQKKMVEYLIANGGNPKITGGRFGTMLNAAAASGIPALVQYTLEDKVGFRAWDVDHEGRSAAHMACSGLNRLDYFVNTLTLLSQETGSQDLLWKADKHGRLPLHFACGGPKLDALRHLLSDCNQSSKVNEPDKDGWTALHWACRQWDILLVRFLVEKGADTRRTTDKGWTPWDVAVFHNNTDFAPALGRNDSEPNANDAVRVKGERRGAYCDSCCQGTMYGTRYTCRECQNFDLCFKCYDRSSQMHHENHEFIATETDEELKQAREKGIGSKKSDNAEGGSRDEAMAAPAESESDSD